jgi:polycystin 1L2
MSQVNGFKGFVGYGIRELSQNDLKLYCSDTNASKRLEKLPIVKTTFNFTSNFMIRSYTSGCYYFDVLTGKWSSSEMDVYEDTNLVMTHCSSNHLTSFAAGLVLSPSIINFRYEFANYSLNRNPFIYASMILIGCIYILFALWAHLMDLRDLKRLKIVSLKDNFPSDSYFYEIIVFTGNRSESGTRSKVNFNFKSTDLKK